MRCRFATLHSKDIAKNNFPELIDLATNYFPNYYSSSLRRALIVIHIRIFIPSFRQGFTLGYPAKGPSG